MKNVRYYLATCEESEDTSTQTSHKQKSLSVVPRSIYANQRQIVWLIYPTRQNIKNKHDACIGTSFGQCFETNQRASVHVWKKIAHVRPLQTTQCIPYKLSLHTLNSIDVCAIERPSHTTDVFKFRSHKGKIKGIRVPKLTRQLLHKPHHCQSPSNHNINMLSKRHVDYPITKFRKEFRKVCNIKVSFDYT
jgi:hypothetical protein